MKVIDMIFEKRLRKVAKLDDMQMRFKRGRGSVDAIFILQHMLEKFDTAGRNMYIMFVDREKAFERLPRKVIWWNDVRYRYEKNAKLR